MAGRLFAAALLGIGAVQLSAGWAGVLAPVVLILAALLPYGALLVAPRLRVSPVLAAVALLSIVVLGAHIAAASGGAGGWTALGDAVPRLLTAPRPAPSTPDLLAPGSLLAALIAIWVGARMRRPGGGLFAPVVGAATLYVAAALLTAGEADRYGVVAATLALCAAAGWTLRERRRETIAVRAAPAVAVGALGAVFVAALVPTTAAFEPRTLVSPPPVELSQPNPLPRLPAFAKQGDVEMFRHTGGANRLHLVSLVDFNGASWAATARYRELGTVNPASLEPGRRRTTVTADVTISALDGAWLPATGSPTAVSLPGALVDPDSGSLALPDGLRSGLRYRVQGQIDAPGDADLAVAAVPRAPAYLGVPRLPYLFADYLGRIVRGAATPFEQAVLIESAVKESRRLVADAPVGSSYARLETFLFGRRGDVFGRTGDVGAQVGTSEQFATSFAVLARAAGLPTRVVMGFLPGERAANGVWVVHGRDALAWPEVYFTGQGWVPFDPTPSTSDLAGPKESTKRQVLDRVGQYQPPPPPKQKATAPAPATTAKPGPNRSDARVAPASRPLWSFGNVGTVLGGTAAALLALILVRRTVRRSRHRRAGPAGAWSEVLDLLVLIGRRPPPWRPAPWVADDLATAVPVAGVHPARRLAEYADQAAFALSVDRSGRAWVELRGLRREVRRTVPWYRRATWPFDPRPLRRR